jgi:hypothetical protein
MFFYIFLKIEESTSFPSSLHNLSLMSHSLVCVLQCYWKLFSKAQELPSAEGSSCALLNNFFNEFSVYMCADTDYNYMYCRAFPVYHRNFLL